MGSKLGKMVKIIKISFVGILSLSLFASDALEKNIDLTKLSKIEDGDALVLTLNGSKDGLSLKKSAIKKDNLIMEVETLEEESVEDELANSLIKKQDLYDPTPVSYTHLTLPTKA